MRVTNQMMNNNALYNLQRQQSRLSELEQQYASQKKISKPSDDPIIAVRSLKLRTNYSEILQYVTKNIPDAEKWLSMTHSAVDNTSSMLQSIYEQCGYGATDTLETKDREAIGEMLKQYREQIYQEGTSTYAGRYLFTGYKTDTNLIFEENTDNTKYTITQNFSQADVDTKHYVIDEVNALGTAGKVPTRIDVPRIRLAYEDCDKGAKTTIRFTDKDGNPVNPVPNMVPYDEPTDDAYQPEDDEINYIPLTGELILGKNVATNIRKNGYQLSVDYQKSRYQKNDLRPEHYFTCTKTDPDTGKVINYKDEDQKIEYAVNYNQKIQVNVQAKECYTHSVGRDLDDIIAAIDDMNEVEQKVSELEREFNQMKDTDAGYENKRQLLEQAKTEAALKSEILRVKFSEGQTLFNKHVNTFSKQLTSIGARQTRLSLITSRMEEQSTNVEDLMSSNEDVELADVIVRYTSANNVYNAALSAASKCIKQTLLDFI